MRVCEVTSKEQRREAGELLRREIATHTNVPECVFQYIENASKSNWKTRFPWSRILIKEGTDVPPKKRFFFDDGAARGAVVKGVILCEPDDDDKSLEIRFVAGLCKTLLDAAKDYCIQQGYDTMYVWCGEWFEYDASCFAEYGFVAVRRQQNWEESSHYSVLYSFKILNVV
jgi:hypothetical protein